MQTENLAEIKQQIVLLDDESKKVLADFLAQEIAGKSEVSPASISETDRESQLEWLKQNREKYAGKYIALNGNEFVGEGKTLREAREKAKAKGFDNAFVTFVYSELDVPFGGW